MVCFKDCLNFCKHPLKVVGGLFLERVTLCLAYRKNKGLEYSTKLNVNSPSIGGKEKLLHMVKICMISFCTSS